MLSVSLVWISNKRELTSGDVSGVRGAHTYRSITIHTPIPTMNLICDICVIKLLIQFDSYLGINIFDILYEYILKRLHLRCDKGKAFLMGST